MTSFCVISCCKPVADPGGGGGVRGCKCTPPFEGLPSRVLSKSAQTYQLLQCSKGKEQNF